MYPLIHSSDSIIAIADVVGIAQYLFIIINRSMLLVIPCSLLCLLGPSATEYPVSGTATVIVEDKIPAVCLSESDGGCSLDAPIRDKLIESGGLARSVAILAQVAALQVASTFVQVHVHHLYSLTVDQCRARRNLCGRATL